MVDMPTDNDSFGRRGSYSLPEMTSNMEAGLKKPNNSPANNQRPPLEYDHNSNYQRHSFRVSDVTSGENSKKRTAIACCLMVGLVLLILAIILPVVFLGKDQSDQSVNETVALKGSVLSRLARSPGPDFSSYSSFPNFLKALCEIAKSGERDANLTDKDSLELLRRVDCHPDNLKTDYVAKRLARMVQTATADTTLCSTIPCQKVDVANVGLDDEFLNFDFQIETPTDAEGSVSLSEVSPSEMTLTTKDHLEKAFREEFTPFSLENVVVKFELEDFCQQDKVHCSDDIMSRLRDVEEEKTRAPPTEAVVVVSKPEEGDLSVESLKGKISILITNCTSYGYTCKDQKKVINKHQVCDGIAQCDDGSDEANCETCKTAFSCKRSDGTLHCLRGSQLCNGVKDCQDGSDEATYCNRTCTTEEIECKNHKLCIPVQWKCDGDVHCPDGDDETLCTNHCNNGAVLCSGNCTAVWHVCDGIAHCRNAEDEFNCTCEGCSADHLALCREPGLCITKSQACDGVMDCPDEEDEENCPGSCKPESKLEQVKCINGEMYPKDAACTGRVPFCREDCPGCDENEAFRCNITNSCIERNKICDGKADCLDASDESSSLCACNSTDVFVCNATAGGIRCIPLKYRCDGYHDCLGSVDEKDCDSCYNNPAAVYCNATRTCFPRTARCNGEVDCPDYSDEDDCPCSQCKNQLEPTYMCRERKRCLLRRYACNQLSPHHCPGRVPEDEMYCPPVWDPFRGYNEVH